MAVYIWKGHIFVNDKPVQRHSLDNVNAFYVIYQDSVSKQQYINATLP